MMSYWPGLKGFGMDPVGTLPDIVNNSLIHSWGGTVDLLPALPEAWPAGSIRGILARGQLTIDNLAWDRPAGQIKLALTSGVDQTLALRLPPEWRITSTDVTGEASVERVADDENLCKLNLNKEKSIELNLHFSESR